MERLAALEAEVKADADAAGARKAAAVAKLRDQRVTQAAERDALRARQAELVSKRTGRAKPAAKPSEPDDLNDLDLAPGKKSLGESITASITESVTDRIRRKAARAAEPEGLEELDEDNARRADHLENLGGALELASKANRVKQELTRAPKKGEKSWIKSGVASLALGPIGWLYAGSLREAVPATAGWVLLAAIASKILPAFLLMPVLMVVLPLSAIAGIVYALQYNRNGSRQRLFDSDKPAPKQLRSD